MVVGLLAVGVVVFRDGFIASMRFSSDRLQGCKARASAAGTSGSNDGGRVVPRLYLELPDHLFTLNSNFDEVKVECYDALIIPGGRLLLRVATAKSFCRATGLLKGKKCTAFASMKPMIVLADGLLMLNFSKLCLNPWEPFRVLQALGCKVDKVASSKNKGETCVAAIHDDEGAQVFSEKRGHYLFITADWSDIRVCDYDCLVVPGGRPPELRVMNNKAVNLVKEFAEKTGPLPVSDKGSGC
ncbi:hypothetical protein F3Y22_tig00111310pilonHSYRG00012 [Hibiscus syriacus]|uniref:DJ-1/PfpI domain-containing protein n=1 Tax=Hibiscus syriacus TaxID=106335 RepID=A0A6A2YR12_HIBSY|nr:hypothetical protein F3Y22_tig00111310pilonHSYRG00012 [Hibiscus syriacus]